MTLRNPRWLIEYSESTKIITDELFAKINEKLVTLKENPEVSIVIPAWNEEKNIIRCIWSLANQVTSFSYEIIVVDNNSSDRTAEYLKKLNIKSFKQVIQGTGPSRKLGQEKAKGTFILMGDADSIYPKEWVELMISKLKMTKAVAILGKFTFIGDNKHPRWKFYLYDQIKKPFLALRKRPYLSASGANLAYIKELGVLHQDSFDLTSGEDGVLVMNLMQHGRIAKMTHSASLAWTSYRAFLRDGSLLSGIKKRLTREIAIIIRDHFTWKR